MNRQTWNWDDLRVFLAAMRAASLRQVADLLGVSHPTVRRRIQSLEEDLGMPLFERRPDGLHATAQAVALMEAAEAAEAAMHAVGRAAQAADPEVRGSVRISLPLAGLAQLLMPAFAEFSRQWPHIEIILQPTNVMSDLARRDADVALRLERAGQSPSEHLAGRRVGRMFRAVYGEGSCWIGWRGGGEDRDWIEQSAFPGLPSRGGFGDPEIQVAACAAGMGLALLPCYLADSADLPRVTEPVPEWDIWLLVHPDLRKNPRLRIFRDFLAEQIRDLAPVLEGRTGQ